MRRWADGAALVMQISVILEVLYMFIRTMGSSALLVAFTLVACNRQNGDSDSDKPKVEEPTSGQPRTPLTPEEQNPVVVDETGATAPVAIDKPAPASPVNLDNAPCTSASCFKIGQWSLSFGQTYQQFLKDGNVTTVLLDGFENSKLTRLQALCLLETANALREYAREHPGAMKPFADAGINTTFAARVYDTTFTKDKVAPDLYFIKGSDGREGGVSLSRGKWVIRSAITGDKSKDDCQILNPEQIKDKLAFWKGRLVAQ